MSIKAVLFDLDGTLLPMDAKVFIDEYKVTMGKKIAPYGYNGELLVKAIWGGIGEMQKNDGTVTNEEVYNAVFHKYLGDDMWDIKKILADYHLNEFQQVKDVCGYNPKAAESVRACKEMGYRVVLATNPVFPSIATESRMRWAGLEPEEFELYTTYENSSFCKPSLEYYVEIMNKLGLSPEECLMVGNDVTEDMVTEELGMKVFLLTNDLINREGKDISRYPQGDYDDLLNFIKEM